MYYTTKNTKLYNSGIFVTQLYEELISCYESLTVTFHEAPVQSAL